MIRKHAIRLLSGPIIATKEHRVPGRGRPSKYRDAEFKGAVRRVWRVTGYPCGKAIKAGIPQWLWAIEDEYGCIEESVHLRSEDLPVVIFNSETGKGLYRDLDAMRTRSAEQGSGGEPFRFVRLLGADLMSHLKSNSYGHDLTQTMTIGVDQVAGRGIIGFGPAVSPKE